MIIRSKHPNIIIKLFLQNWISMFRSPKKVFSDKGPERGGECGGLLLKVKEDINCPWKTALAWAVNANNYFINVCGFSPHQLVFETNTNLLSS